jgi:electron transport complex protein RnfD
MAVTFVVSASPHIHARDNTGQIMGRVILALLPAAVASTLIFGWRSLAVITVSVAVSVGVEALSQRVFRRPITVRDGSAVVTGLLLAFTLPATIPLWMVALGAAVAIFMVKQLFGGLGFNIFNPALAARAVLLSSFPVAMTAWSEPAARWLAADAVSAASALGVLKEAALKGAAAAQAPYGYLRLFLGTVPGSLGETSKVALLAGFILLLAFKIVTWEIPVTFVGSVALLSWIFGRDPLAAVLSGGLFLGAFFMATDMVTGPTTSRGRLLFGLGCGILTALIRSYGGFPEGVCYSILFMNCLTPLIERSILPRRFGLQKAGKGVAR